MSFFSNRATKIKEGVKKTTSFDEIQATWNDLSDQARILDPRTAVEGRRETFANAYARLGLDEVTLALVYRNWVLRCWFGIAFIAIGIALGVYFVSADGEMLNLFGLVGFLAVAASQFFAGSFRAYQIRKRETCPVSDWLSHKNEWVPLSMKLPRRKTRSEVMIKK